MRTRSSNRSFAVSFAALFVLGNLLGCGSSGGDAGPSSDDTGTVDDSTTPSDTRTSPDSRAETSADSAVTDSGSKADSAVADSGTVDSATSDTTTTDTAVADTLVADSASDDTALDVATDVPGACNTLAQLSAQVDLNFNPSDKPASLPGGSIVDGLYKLTFVEQYTGPGGRSGTIPGVWIKETVEISLGGTHLEQFVEIPGSAPMRASSTVVATTTAGSGSLLVTYSCGGSSTPATIGYAATATTFETLDGTTHATFTLVP